TSSGHLRGYAKVIRDITERKRAEETLRESEERYRVIAETASDAIITIDGESRILFANPAAGKVFGLPVDELLGRELTMLMPERLRNAHLAAMTRYLATGKKMANWGGKEVPGLHRDGHEIPLEVSYGEFLGEEKHFFTGIVRDITERKQAEKEKEYQDMLERFSREIETRVTERTMNLMALTLADRVRNPASVIRLIAKRILEKGEVPERVREGLMAISDQGDKLEAIVKEFQSLLKSRESMFTYEDINEIVSEVLPIAEREARGRGVELDVDFAGGPLKINAQKDLVKIAVYHLLRNAIEATAAGGRVALATWGDGNTVILSVSDTGQGIPEDVVGRIFDPLFSTKTRRFGMGLPLLKQIVSEHMGSIDVESGAGKGTTFRLRFPVRWSENRQEG
ncbi:MAG: PAS domain S-box protein, partial [Nitrospirae bacterium]|nr:PAS domain S-box protein [Nitrospirota bacterium]